MYLLSGKGTIRTKEGTTRVGEGTIRASQKFKCRPILWLILKIRKYYQNEPKFNVVYSGNNFPKVKDRAYVINPDGFKSIGSHWIALNPNGNNIIYFDSFGVERIPKEIKEFIGNKNIITNIYRIQAYDNVWILLYWIYCFYAKRLKVC